MSRQSRCVKRLEGSWPNLLMEMWHSQTKTQWEGVREEEWSLRKDCKGGRKGEKRKRRQGGEEGEEERDRRQAGKGLS